MYPSVKDVVAGTDRVLSIVFDNGEHGVLDMKEYLDFGIFQLIKDHDAFSGSESHSTLLNGTVGLILP